MSEKSERISKLIKKNQSRRAYAKAHLIINIPSQIRALRRRQNMSQKMLAEEAEMLQPRISAMERPGETNYNIETLVRLAAAFKVALMVKFVSFSDLLKWENEFSQDTFNVVTVDNDLEFQKEEEEEETRPAAVGGSLFNNLAGRQGDVGRRSFTGPQTGLQKFLKSNGTEGQVSNASH